MAVVSRQRANIGDIPDDTSNKYYQQAGESQNHWSEHANSVDRSGQTPAPADGTGEDLYQTGRAMMINALAAQSFQDNGSANTYELTPLTGSSGLIVPDAFGQLLGAKLSFVVSNTNTGASTINYGQDTGSYKGAKAFRTAADAAFTGGEVTAGDEVIVRYDPAADGASGAYLLIGKYQVAGASPLTTKGDIFTYSTGDARFAAGATGSLLGYDSSTLTGLSTFTPSNIVRIVSFFDGTVATGTNTFPYGAGIPINTDGDQYLAGSITPQIATNKLQIDVIMMLSHSSNTGQMYGGLFQDAIANALKTGLGSKNPIANGQSLVTFSHVMDAGTTSLINFYANAGASVGGTTTFNGTSGAVRHGGVLASGMIITEYKV